MDSAMRTDVWFVAIWRRRIHLFLPTLLVTSYVLGAGAWTVSVQERQWPRLRRPMNQAMRSTASGSIEKANDSPKTTCCIHLLSLQWTSEDVHFSKAIREAWRWKDSVLGDGRDFFVPKTKTLKRLNQFVINSVPKIKECAVLSNCARFEILLVWEDGPTDDQSKELRQAVSQAVSKQVCFHRSRPMNPFLEQLARLDRASMVNPKAKDFNKREANEMVEFWTHLEGVECVCRHLSRVSAGMAERPNRPSRAVPFRPFSSRDAHILLQLKRTAEVAKGSKVKIVLDAALSAGKAARDPSQVPLLQKLKGYGSDSKYSQEIPTDLSEAAADAAMQLAVEPTVAKCVSKFQAMSVADTIARLRQQGETFAQDSAELKVVRQRLHQPTLDLRQGRGRRHVDEGKVLAEIQGALQEIRKG